ncbi:hypothetical protein [uncultured Pseudokineococcus sp.]|uniref:hypothetical protein n=1 Tax=uncultured Pseudokineococcus sp. TaxID=1642928 RepID=UPI0026315744|nr:hypothetical protein [uncultured Pseudokineococcus sp.]
MADAAYVLLTLGGFAALLLLVRGLEALTLDRTSLAPAPDEPAPDEPAPADRAPGDTAPGDAAPGDAAPADRAPLETAGRRS